LLLNTIKEIFNGNKELFKGLWIYDKIEWEKYPVIKFSFSSIDYKSVGLSQAIKDELDKIANSQNIKLRSKTVGSKFRELIETLSEKTLPDGRQGKTVILIDEYDKPIIDYIDDIPKAEENRMILKDFYSIVKDSDSFIKFFFITGVSKFSHVSIFSDLNNLNDITLDKNYAVLTGYTQKELETYFSEYIEKVAIDYEGIFPDLMLQIKKWYNGYSWDGQNFVYNPFSILNFFYKRAFKNYWFSTGTPTFLMKLIKEKRYTAFEIENREIFESELNNYEITDISLIPLLFQTGYLTIKKTNLRENTLLLDFPNREVERSFSIHLLAELSTEKLDNTSTMLVDIIHSLKNNQIEKFIELINVLYKGISYTITDNKEKYFHSIFYIIVKLLGFNIETEILTIDGRIDTVILTDNNIYIIEFKAGHDAKKALEQIKTKGYHKKYANDKRPKSLIGINFNIEKKCIDDFVIE